MQKPPVTISIVPSRLAVGLHLGMALGALMVSMVYAPPWLSAAAALCLGIVLWGYVRRRRGGWQLRFVDHDATGAEWSVSGEWQVQPAGEAGWTRCSVGCGYLGPWLVGLTLAHESHWLWPDSLSKEDGRALRRLLVAGKADI
ncbi:MAG: protein YgfX [Onishia taeanensis]|uniref:protein YgfX n=1 Tax=Onishia taeanensis TaxID=284577 RepID=UPI003C7B1917